MIKKLTIRLNLEDEKHQMADEILTGRNRGRYRAVADYIVPAVIEFANKMEQTKNARISEQDRKQIIAEVLQELEGKARPTQEPGI